MELNPAVVVETQPGAVRMPKKISTLDEYEAATQRVRELSDKPEGTPEAAELAELVEAIMDWDKAHDDATAWKD